MKKPAISETQLERIFVIKKVEEKLITQLEAADLLNLTTRQVRRLQEEYRINGQSGLKPKYKGRSRLYTDDQKEKIMGIVKTKYHDYSAVFAAEKLEEIENIKINHETLRQYMLEAGLRKARKRYSPRIHQTRDRRPCFGELIQGDGSPHDWFEGRAPVCCLYVLIDDATSQIITMRFELTETSEGYLRCIEAHITTYGKPLAYYTDKHSIFKTTRSDPNKMYEDTQVHRAMRSLNIELICANSPQAKGRVERANQTLQDRLIKEMRLKNICSIEEGNAYLPEYIEKHNKKFAIKPKDEKDAHRPLQIEHDQLKSILSHHETRILTKNLECRYKNKLFQIISMGGGFHLRKAEVTVCAHLDGKIEIYYKGKQLAYVAKEIIKKEIIVADRKDINEVFRAKIIPMADRHPLYMIG